MRKNDCSQTEGSLMFISTVDLSSDSCFAGIYLTLTHKTLWKLVVVFDIELLFGLRGYIFTATHLELIK